MYYGPIITGVFGKTLHMIDKKILQSQHVGGVILFGQNYSNKQQIKALIEQIQLIRKKCNLPSVLILIDHEGGAVQRLVGEPFTLLPSPRFLGELYLNDPQKAIELAQYCALITAYEFHSIGINVCLGPVLDLLSLNTKEEMSRFYSHDPKVIVALTTVFNSVLHHNGILTVSKHFPGMGHSKTNTHYQISISDSEFSTLLAKDLQPFLLLQKKNSLPAIMTAHRIFPKIHAHPVSTSSKWLKEILRKEFNYRGLVFSDCLQMVGAGMMGASLADKIYNALRAGCDFVISSQTPFDSYTELYKILSSSCIDELLGQDLYRNERIANTFAALSSKFIGDFNDYQKGKQIITEITRQKKDNVTKKIPFFCVLKKRVMQNKRLKKYFKNHVIIHRLAFYQFQLRLFMYKLKNNFRK